MSSSKRPRRRRSSAITKPRATVSAPELITMLNRSISGASRYYAKLSEEDKAQPPWNGSDPSRLRINTETELRSLPWGKMQQILATLLYMQVRDLVRKRRKLMKKVTARAQRVAADREASATAALESTSVAGTPSSSRSGSGRRGSTLSVSDLATLSTTAAEDSERDRLEYALKCGADVTRTLARCSQERRRERGEERRRGLSTEIREKSERSFRKLYVQLVLREAGKLGLLPGAHDNSSALTDPSGSESPLPGERREGKRREEKKRETLLLLRLRL